MKKPALCFGIIIILITPLFSYGQDVLNIGGFDGLGAASDVADAKGFLADERITVVFHEVHDSVDLMTNFVSGNTDLIQTNADNIIAWEEGQGMDQTTHDFVIIMGGYSGLEPREFTVAPEIRSLVDVRGKVLAVDAINTGYAPVLVYMLKENGLVWNEDYTLKSVGGGAQRRESMLRGETAGGLVGLTDDLEQAGFHVLARSTDYFIDYSRGVTAARRDWADENGELLVRYIRALVRSINWLLEPENRMEAISIIMEADGMSQAEAQQFYEESVDPRFGFIPNAKLEHSGVEQIIKIREVMGQMRPPLPPASKYIEERFYQEAIDSL